MKALDYKATYDSEKFQKEYTYDGKDLGAVIEDGKTYFRIWSPVAESVQLFLYSHGDYARGTVLTDDEEKALLNDIQQFSLPKQMDTLEKQNGLIQTLDMKKEKNGV